MALTIDQINNGEVSEKDVVFDIAPTGQDRVFSKSRANREIEADANINRDPDMSRLTLSGIVDQGIEVVDDITSIPGQISEKANRINERIIEAAERFRAGAVGRAEQNLRQQKVGSIGARFAKWLDTGNNKWFAVAGAVLLFIIIRKI